MDEELLLRAKEALEDDQLERAGILLDAVQQQETPVWAAARAEVLRRTGDYARALEFYRKSEQNPQTLAGIEQCCRELGDYKGAYEAACKLRTLRG